MTDAEPDGGVAEGTALGLPSLAADGSPLGQVATIARLEFSLAVRNRWAFALTALFASLSVLVVALGGQGGVVRADAVVVSLVELSALLLPLVALLFGYDAVVGSDESGWLGVLFALPIPRGRVVLGTYLGRLAVFSGGVVAGFGVGGLWLAIQGRLTTAYLGLVGAAVLGGAAFLALSVLLSTLAAEKTHALGGALLLWVWVALVHDLVSVGLIAADVVGPNWLPVFVLANPATAFRVLALQSVPTVTGGMAEVLVGSGVTTPVLVAALVVWSAAGAWLASRLIARRSV
ncbi:MULTISPECIES: ABC transporter permease [Halolamina]|uniref:Cu-processing system permease protein n=1 Tax=Halolamina pelagica TaxID=699431 RepID=A0A1I5MUH1_9EURY|nr:MULTISPECIES: ABC transporter permease subunit [Halolamina]NHX36162.1 ABC transporter permease subunit [Halolamina sp. R1-12]SFP13120.1 Cu-processing system permease protein [Halolamina pelagica]